MGFWWGNLRERDNFVSLGIDRRITLKPFFKKCDVWALTRLAWLKIGTGGELLWIWQ